MTDDSHIAACQSPPGPLATQVAIFCLTCTGLAVLSANPCFGQTSPELAMRDFSSGQIKKGVRSIGFGGDGATWGNYGLVWKDAGTALLDYGDTSYSNGNDFHFEALGATTPSLWHNLVIYFIAMQETTNNVRANLKLPRIGLG